MAGQEASYGGRHLRLRTGACLVRPFSWHNSFILIASFPAVRPQHFLSMSLPHTPAMILSAEWPTLHRYSWMPMASPVFKKLNGGSITYDHWKPFDLIQLNFVCTALAFHGSSAPVLEFSSLLLCGLGGRELIFNVVTNIHTVMVLFTNDNSKYDSTSGVPDALPNVLYRVFYAPPNANCVAFHGLHDGHLFPFRVGDSWSVWVLLCFAWLGLAWLVL